MCLSVLLLLAAVSPVVTFSPRGSVHVHSPGAAQLGARQGTAVPAGSPHFHLCAVCCSMTVCTAGCATALDLQRRASPLPCLIKRLAKGT